MICDILFPFVSDVVSILFPLHSNLRIAASLRFPWPLHGLVQLSEACNLCATATQKLQQRICRVQAHGLTGSGRSHRKSHSNDQRHKKKYEMKKTVPKTLPKTSSKCKTSEKVYESISFTASYYFIKHVDIFRPCSQDCRYLICRWSSKLMAVRDQASNSSFGVAASTDRRVLWVRESWHCPNVPCNPVLVQVRIDSNR